MGALRKAGLNAGSLASDTAQVIENTEEIP